MLPRMEGRCQTATAKNLARADIRLGEAVARDDSALARRWPHLGLAVRRVAPGDTADDIVGVVMERQLDGLEDPERPGASGSGTVARSGLAWARKIGPVTGAVNFPIDIAELRHGEVGRRAWDHRGGAALRVGPADRTRGPPHRRRGRSRGAVRARAPLADARRRHRRLGAVIRRMYERDQLRRPRPPKPEPLPVLPGFVVTDTAQPSAVRRRRRSR